MIALFSVSSAQAQETEADRQILEQELRYIDLLQRDLMMPDIAEEVIVELRKKFPEAIAELKVREINGQLSQGKFAEVQKVIDAMPDKNAPEYWAMVLAMADMYYAFGKYPESDKLYLNFFKKYPKPPQALVKFYKNSAYKYGRMLIYLGRDKEAVASYQRVLALLDPQADYEARRSMLVEILELQMKVAVAEKNKAARDKMLAEVEKMADQVLWEPGDLWFGKALVAKAHVRQYRGNVKGAQDLIDNYMGQLRTMHDKLKELDPDGSQGIVRLSPMPQCRYLLGTMLWDEVQAELKKDKPDDDKIKNLILGERGANKKRNGKGAFNHFLNVFIRYPECQWASEAGEYSERIRELVRERYETNLRTPVTPAQMAKVRQMQFANARLAFSQNQFKNAIEKYLDVLNQFPESEESVSALGDLVHSYIETMSTDPQAELMADTVTGYLSERFAANPKLMKNAGDVLRKIGDTYGEMRNNKKKDEVYALFFRDYPTHYAAGSLLMSFAERQFAVKNFTGAMNYYRQIATSYTNSTAYYSALSRIAQIYQEEGNETNAIDALEYYVAELGKKDRPGHEMIAARFRLSEACRDYGTAMLKNAATNETFDAAMKESLQKEATRWVSKAAGNFGQVAELLEKDPDAYQQNQKEREKNAEFRELSLFLKAICLTQIKSPNEKIAKKLRLFSIKAFEDYVKAFPQGKYAPRALVQVGTLYTILEDAEKAQVAFDKLASDYPTSEEAKNSVPMLAAALIDMGLHGEGVAKYRQMLAAGGKYTDDQYLSAAKALEEAREFDLAVQSYDKVLGMVKPDQLTSRARALLGKARCQFGQKRYMDAHKTLDTFTKDKKLSRVQQVLDAYELLVRVASEEGKTERDHEARTILFNTAIDALKMVRNYATPKAENGKDKPASQWTNEERLRDADLNLQSGEILVRRYEAEKKMGLEEKAAKTRGEAIVAFMSRIMAMNGKEEFRPVLERAYFNMIPLMLEHKQDKQAEEYCNEYLKAYPDGKYKTDVNNWLNQAKIGQ